MAARAALLTAPGPALGDTELVGVPCESVGLSFKGWGPKQNGGFAGLESTGGYGRLWEESGIPPLGSLLEPRKGTGHPQERQPPVESERTRQTRGFGGILFQSDAVP